LLRLQEQDEDIGEVSLYGSAASGLAMSKSSDLDLAIDYYGSKSYNSVLKLVRSAL
jgi:predicted nucleotidyltransferase